MGRDSRERAGCAGGATHSCYCKDSDDRVLLHLRVRDRRPPRQGRRRTASVTERSRAACQVSPGLGDHRSVEFIQGRLRCQRLGSIEPVRQSVHSGAPCRRGIWVFPYGHFYLPLAEHKYRELLPKRLRWSQLDAVFGDLDDLTAEGWLRWDVAAAELQTAQSQWIARHGARVLPLREFWYGGLVYGRLAPDGSHLTNGEWYAMPVAAWVKAARKNLASPWGHRLEREHDVLIRRTTPHLEMFLPAGDLRSWVG